MGFASKTRRSPRENQETKAKMALDTQYHCSIKLVSRSAGRSAVAAAAYRSGSVLRDERTGLEHDYRRKRGVVLSEIAVPPGCDWALDRANLWNAVEGKTRANGRVATECEVSLPHTLNDEQRAELVRGFAASLAAEGVAVDYNIHAPHPHRRPRDGAAGSDLPGDDDRNWHAHILCSHLPVTPDGPGKPVSKLFDGPERVEAVRTRWAEHVNRAYVAAGLDLRQDHRSYRDQGTDRVPTKHLGPTVAALERRGVRTEHGDTHRARAEKRLAELAITLLDGEQKRRAAHRQRSPPPVAPPPAPPAPKPPQQQQEAKPMSKKYTPRGRVTGKGGRPPRRPPQQREPQHQHEQTDDLRAWLWTQAYAPAAMPRNWLMATTAMWTFSQKGDPDGIYAQLSGDAGRLYDNGSSVTWSHTDTPTNEQRSAAVSAMLDMAEARAWTAMSFSGDPKFRKEAARQATQRGITVTDADLQVVVNDERRRLAEQGGTPTPGAANGIAQATRSTPAAAISAAGTPTQPPPTVAAFLAAGGMAGNSGHDLNAWLMLYAMLITHGMRDEITAHLAASGQPAGMKRWAQATETALAVEALTAAQQRGDMRALRSVLDVTPPERRRVVSDVLHARADEAATGSPTDFDDTRRRSAAQALAHEWDRLSDVAERATLRTARVEEPPRSPPTISDIRRLGETLHAAQRAERDADGDPYDTLRAERALSHALDRTTPETRRALADGLTDRRGGKTNPLASMLAFASMAANGRINCMAAMSEERRRALRPPKPGQTPEEESSNNNEHETLQPDFY